MQKASMTSESSVSADQPKKGMDRHTAVKYINIALAVALVAFAVLNIMSIFSFEFRDPAFIMLFFFAIYEM
jgi:hypothetical protein